MHTVICAESNSRTLNDPLVGMTQSGSTAHPSLSVEQPQLAPVYSVIIQIENAGSKDGDVSYPYEIIRQRVKRNCSLCGSVRHPPLPLIVGCWIVVPMEQQCVTYGAPLSWIVVRVGAAAHSYQF